MFFYSALELIGWSFQMISTQGYAISRYSDDVSSPFMGLSQSEQRCLAVDVIAKVGRLPLHEQAVIAAYLKQSPSAAKKAALLVLPRAWPAALKIEITRAWAGMGERRSQSKMAETYMLSQQTISRRVTAAYSALNETLQTGCDVVSVQVRDLIELEVAC